MVKNNKKQNTNYNLTIGWLYPELMSTYGDMGNILVLKERCNWRQIDVEIVTIDQLTNNDQLKNVDLLFGGGAQDREQEIVMTDLQKKKRTIQGLIENQIPALFVCGAPQLMGNYYEPAEGKRIDGLGIFDIYTKHPRAKKDRLIGNVIAKLETNNLISHESLLVNSYLVGFENHGGRTYLGNSAKPLARIIKGFGNNGDDGTEGVVYKNAIGSYLHGPLLPKNPQIADWLITTALVVKYKKDFTLQPLDDTIEKKAREAIMKKLNVVK
jgi:CobQ-like glutamine amidotransferase family enzyme